MSPDLIGDRRPHVSAAADGALFTAATFALVLGAQGILVWTHVIGPAGAGSGPLFAQILSAAIVLVGQGLTMVMPALIWVFHGHPLSGRTMLALVCGYIGSAIALGILAGMLSLIGGLLTPLVGSEVAALIAMIVVIGLVFVAGVVLVLVDSAQDLVPTRHAHRWLDIGRIVAVGISVVFILGVLIGMRIDPAGEIGDAIAFVLLAAVFGAVFTVVTDAVSVWLDRRHARGGAVAGM